MTALSFLGTPCPLIQSPMASAQDSRLAAAVSRAGALGSIAAATLDAPTLERELQVMQATGLPYAVNFFVHPQPEPDAAVEARWRETLAPYFAEMGLPVTAPASGTNRRPFGDEAAEVLERFRPPVVSFHFGLPAPDLLARVKRMGSLVISSATTVSEAQWLQDHGADAVIAQGLEAGGHRGHFLDKDPARQAPLFTLLPQVVQALSVPVIAAGGIGDAQDARRAINLGARAVQAGTAFLLCDEAKTSELHRAVLRDADAPTELTNLFSGGLARGIVNRVMKELGPVNDTAPPFPLASGAVGPLRAQAEAAGRTDFTPLWSGTNRRGCRAVPAADIVRALA